MLVLLKNLPSQPPIFLTIHDNTKRVAPEAVSHHPSQDANKPSLSKGKNRTHSDLAMNRSLGRKRHGHDGSAVKTKLPLQQTPLLVVDDGHSPSFTFAT